MSKFINHAQVLWNLTQDPLVKDWLTVFTLATNFDYTKADGEKVSELEFHNCVAYWPNGDLMAHYKKGQNILIDWRIRTRSIVGEDGKKIYKKEIVANNIVLLGNMK